MNESQWLIWARKLQAIAQNGLTTQYGSQDPVDRERYHEVQQVAAEITARHAALPVEEIIDLFDGPSGYAAPRVSVRAAIFDGAQILLVRENRNGLWTTPGGYAEVNETPSEAVEREVLEESGYEVRAQRLLAVRNLVRQPDEPTRFFSYYGLYFDCDALGKVQDASPLETSESAFFPLDALPLTVGLVDRPDEERRVRARQHYERLFELQTNPHLPTDFD